MNFINRLKNLIAPMFDCVYTLTEHECPISSIAISSNGQFLASASWDATVKLWDLRTGKLLHNISSAHTLAVAISPDSQTIIGGNTDGKVIIWSLTNGKHLQTLVGAPNDVDSSVISPDGSIIASASNDAINLLHLETGKLLQTIQNDNRKIIAISPDKQRVAAGSRFGMGGGGPIKLWSIKTGELLSTIGKTRSSFQVVAVKNSTELRSLKNSSNQVETINTSGSGYDTWDCYSFMTFSPDGQTIATSGDDSAVRLWNLKAGKIYKLFGHSETVTSGAFSPNGQILATGSHDNTIKLWNLRTQREICTLPGHSDEIVSIVFSPNGKIIASGSEDSTIKVWSLSNSLF